MANALLLDMVNFLVSKGIIKKDGVDAFRDFTPEGPDSVLVLHEYKGDPASMHDTAVNRSVQITVRDNDPDKARCKAVSAFKAFRNAQAEDGRVDLTTTRWGQVYLRNTPFRLKMDDNNRTIYAFNIGITTTIE